MSLPKVLNIFSNNCSCQRIDSLDVSQIKSDCAIDLCAFRLQCHLSIRQMMANTISPEEFQTGLSGILRIVKSY